MMGEKRGAQGRLFYEFDLEAMVPQDHLLRKIDVVLDLSGLRAELASHYSHTGRPSIDPELMIRMLLVGYCYGIRSERRLCARPRIFSFQFSGGVLPLSTICMTAASALISAPAWPMALSLRIWVAVSVGGFLTARTCARSMASNNACFIRSVDRSLDVRRTFFLLLHAQ